MTKKHEKFPRRQRVNKVATGYCKAIKLILSDAIGSLSYMYMVHTWFFMHLCLPGPKGDGKYCGQSPKFLIHLEEPCKP